MGDSHVISKKTIISISAVLALAAAIFLIVVPRQGSKRGSTAEEYFGRGMGYYNKGSFKEAVSEFEKATEKDPNFAKAHYLLALSYEATGKLDKAIKEYKETAKLQPKEVGARYNLAIAYRERGRTKEAIKELEQAVKLNPNFVSARVILAELYAEEKRVDEAIGQYRIVLDINAYGFNLIPVHLELGLLYRQRGMKNEAVAEWQSVLRLDPSNKRAQDLLTEVSR